MSAVGLRKLGIATAGSSVGGALLVRQAVGKDNFDRSAHFYYVALPGYLVYKATDLTTRHLTEAERSAKFEKLHHIWAPRALEIILELRGFYIKVGQLAATNVGNAFPDVWVRTMEVLQDEVPHKDLATVQSLIEDAYGVPFNQVFEKFDPKPLGAASIGQVHRAKLTESAEAVVQAAAGAALAGGTTEGSAASTEAAAEAFRLNGVNLCAPQEKIASNHQSQNQKAVVNRPNYFQRWPLPWHWGDNSNVNNKDSRDSSSSGRDVVVKVQYPEVEGRFRGDVRTILWFCKLAQPEHVKALEEIEKQFRSEFDYRLEASNLSDVHKNLKEPYPSVLVPTPRTPLCAKRVLVMEDLSPATKLADGLRKEASKLAAALGWTEEELAAKVRAHDAARDAFHRPRSAVHSAEEIDTVVALAAAHHARRDAYMVIRNFLTGCWLPWGLGPAPLERPLRRDVVPLNPARVVDDLFMLHGHEIIVDGCFNGDPHPGNLLLVHGRDSDDGASAAPSLWSATWHYISTSSWWPRKQQASNDDTATPAVVAKEQEQEEGCVKRPNVGRYASGDRLGLIDYGQVKRLSPESRLRFAALITALAADCGTPSDKARVAQALYNIGQRTKHNSQAVLYSTAKLVYDANDPELMNGKHVQLVLDEMQARDPVIEVAEDFVLVGRVCVMLRGLGFVVHQPRSTAVEWWPIARRELVKAGRWNYDDDERIARGLEIRRARNELAAATEADWVTKHAAVLER